MAKNFNRSQVMMFTESNSGKFMQHVEENNGKYHNYLIPLPIYDAVRNYEIDELQFDDGVAGEGDYENWVQHRVFTPVDNSVVTDEQSIKKLEVKVRLATAVKDAAKAGINDAMLADIAPGVDFADLATSN